MGDKKKPVVADNGEQEKLKECLKAHVEGMLDGLKHRIEFLSSAATKYKALSKKQHEVIEAQEKLIAKLKGGLESANKIIEVDEDIIRIQRGHVKWQDKFIFCVIFVYPVILNLPAILNFGCRVWRHFFG